MRIFEDVGGMNRNQFFRGSFLAKGRFWRYFQIILSFVLVVFFSSASSECVGNISLSEYNALEMFFHAMHGEDWRWIRDEPTWHFPSSNEVPCSDGWQGLNCIINSVGEPSVNGECSISSISLKHQRLFGFLPSTLVMLTGLTSLILESNFITSTIPTEFGSFANLSEINLNDNDIQGTLPTELSQLSSLSVLCVAANRLNGSIPTILGSVTSLVFLALGSNSFTGHIPTELSNLPEIKMLLLHSNPLRGTIPTEMGLLTQLKDFHVGDNMLTGTLPTELGNMKSAFNINVGGNRLHGTIPTELGNLVEIQQLYLLDNLFTGGIPTEIGRLTLVTILTFAVNSLDSSFPSELMNLLSLNVLQIGKNLFTGELPTWFGLFSSLQVVDMADNLLTGPLPTQLGQLTHLSELDLNTNYLSRTLPSEFGQLLNLSDAEFARNLLTGSIPASYGNWQKLRFLLLSQNRLSGTLPTLSPTLVQLEVADNSYLVGTVLEQLGNCHRLRSVSVGGNQFNGTLPTALSQLPDLQSLNLSSCLFSGPLSVFAGDENNYAHLQMLSLSDNFFSGTIPSTLFSMRKLHTVLLSQNCFEGSIPSSICANAALENVVLDSLTQNCGSSVPRMIRHIVKGYIPSHYMVNELPSCVWNMTSLKVLHAQGNGLYGTLSELPTNQQSRLSVLSVGSNQLTGPIPYSFQTHVWEQLDLSSNRLDGSLSNELVLDGENTTVYDLTENRLSGPVPNAMLALQQDGVLQLLDGNVFGCVSGLPPTDPDVSSYVCGSESFEAAIITWIVALLFAVLGLSVFASSSIRSTSRRFLSWSISDIKREAVAVEWNRHLILTVFTHSLLIGASVFIALPGYLVLKLPLQWRANFVTHVVQYWWTTTVAYMHSWPVVVFFLLLILFLCCAVSWLLLSVVNGMLLQKEFDGTNIITYSRAFVLHTVNILVVLTINAVYVVDVVPRYSGTQLLLMQFVLGIVKLVWSMMVPMLVALMPLQHRLANNVFMSLFIFIGAPFVSTFLAAKSCFSELFSEPSTLQSSFSVPVIECESYCPMSFCTYESMNYPNRSCHLDCVFGCEFLRLGKVQIDVIAPWLYSYQCSSSVIKDYVPVVIVMFLLTGVVSPSVKAVLMALHFKEYVQLPINMRNIARSYSEALLPLLSSDPNKLTDNSSALPMRCCHQMVVKLFVNISVLLTFGLASPLLAIVVGLGGFTGAVVDHILMDSFVRACSENIKDIDAKKLRQSFLQVYKLQYHHSLVFLMVFVGIFWSLFALDMIGDQNGFLAGCGCAVITLCLPLLVLMCTAVKFVSSEITVDDITISLSRFSTGSSGGKEVEMMIVSPIILPQSTADEFC